MIVIVGAMLVASSVGELRLVMEELTEGYASWGFVAFVIDLKLVQVLDCEEASQNWEGKSVAQFGVI